MQSKLTPIQRRLWQLGLVLVVTLPVILWLWSSPSGSFSSMAGLFRSIGQLSGLIGAALFSANFILAARLGWLEEILEGLPKVYNLHHLAGGLALILLSVHPTFLGLQYLPTSLEAAASFFEPNLNDVPKMLGVAAFSLLSLLLIITFFIRIAYHHWKSTHQWLGLALLLASLHVYLIPGQLDSAPWLRWYMVGLLGSGLLAFAYRVLFGRWLVKRHSYRVEDIRIHQNLVTELSLVPCQSPINHRAGQFFFISIKDESSFSREPHPFSFTSPPGQKKLTMAMKMVGDYTKTISKIRKNVDVAIEGPYGRFLLANGGSHQVWIAGGIGITPFLSRVRELQKGGAPQIHLYYVVKNAKNAGFISELQATATQIESFRLTIWESERQGRFSTNEIDEVLQKDIDYFLCGPSGMMKNMKQDLKQKNVQSRRIKSEEFSLY